METPYRSILWIELHSDQILISVLVDNEADYSIFVSFEGRVVKFDKNERVDRTSPSGFAIHAIAYRLLVVLRLTRLAKELNKRTGKLYYLHLAGSRCREYVSKRQNNLKPVLHLRIGAVLMEAESACF